MHLVVITKIIRQFKPQTVIIDPITNLVNVGSTSEVQSILTRLIDFLQTQQITAVFTGLTLNNAIKEQTDETISSLVDAWIQVRDIENNGERNRGLYIMKSRGMKHSNQVREFLITSQGLYLEDVYLGPDGILTGSARKAHQLQQLTEQMLQQHSLSRNEKEISRKAKELDFKIRTLTSEFESIREELKNSYVETELKKELVEKNRNEMIRMRGNGKTVIIKPSTKQNTK
jgi:circadian clock protein KaiC